MLVHQCIPSISGERKTERKQKVRYFYLHSLAINLRKLKKKNHQKCEGLICCFLKINYCSWEDWYHSVLIQIPLNMTFIHLFKILMCTHCVWYTEICSDIFDVQMDTHINYFHIHMPNFTYVRGGWITLYFIFFASLILFLSLMSFSFCKNIPT